MGIRLPQINIAGTLMLLIVVGGIYAAAKFIPIYLQVAEVESILDSYRHDASKLDLADPGDAEARILESATEDLAELGIDERYVDVYFSDSLESLHADYQVIVQFPFGKSMAIEMARSIEVPQ